jgi:alpha-mannosidase
MDEFWPGRQDSIRRCRKIAEGFLGDKFDSDEVYKSKLDPIVYGIGHCHIDTCWLWPWDETKRKVARSWSNQVRILEANGSSLSSPTSLLRVSQVVNKCFRTAKLY